MPFCFVCSVPNGWYSAEAAYCRNGECKSKCEGHGYRFCIECSTSLNACAGCDVNLSNYQVSQQQIADCIKEAEENLENLREIYETRRPESWRDVLFMHEEYVKWSENLKAKIN